MELQKEMQYNIHEDKKRKMKTPRQLEVLEQVFAEEKYPSESVRVRLSMQLGLSNRQLKMWFCHRRLKERKSKGGDEEHGSSDKSPNQHDQALSRRHYAGSTSSPRRSDYPSHKGEQLSGNSYHSQDDFAWEFRRRGDAFVERDYESQRRKRNRPTTWSSADFLRVAELQAIASVEAQLGEPLRWDSPCVGVEFDPPPSWAFASEAVSSPHPKTSPPRALVGSSSHHKPDSWLQRDTPSWRKGNKIQKLLVTDNWQQYASSRSGLTQLQEYQFIPERPTGQDGMAFAHEKSSNPKMLRGFEPNQQGLVVQSSLLRGSESTGPGSSLQRDVYDTHMFPQTQFLPQESLSDIAVDARYGGYRGHGHNNKFQFIPTIEEIRAKEVEAHLKRVRKELEREELARQKRDEQVQKEREKEVEKLLKEKQRDDERSLRDKQREDERLQREARREFERQERFLQKEAQRLEREREKEEARRLKEATRLKVAIERATARRLARECVELIDDERLELLEVAATSQGLPSIYLLDAETLQGLDRYKDFLKRFPPSVVKMKKPLAISPWNDSLHNLGNLFMVWGFLIAFTDVLGLWPFTVDELVQAFHDYESRLLADIHISLFKIIVKDVDDMARASANAGAVNQYTAASTIGGGHTQLVEAAFAWGFNYRNWSRYLNASTWPEVLRQFSLAAGFGGSISKQQGSGQYGEKGRQIHFKGIASLNSLRSGTPAPNASFLLKAEGGSHIRKCVSRLTPGTVKFAAFHVLSVEGPGGLPIVEIVARIEKYGLRDLSTSKTPESSVAAALSRDTMFFDRVAPSTYCVKPAYRKNPQDAERLLLAASKRIQVFQNGRLDACDEEKFPEATEEGEKEPLVGDDAEDFPVEDIHGGADKGKVTFSFKDGKIISAGGQKVRGCPGKIKSKSWESEGKHESNAVVQDGRQRRVHRDKTHTSAVDNEIDESHEGEPWVQGLFEGEYSGLSVEERLNALVALVEAVNEGNTVRAALEDRMESATALKRQMWAEAQLDKRRFKEEQLSKLQPQIVGEGTNMSSAMRNGRISEPPNVQSDVRESPVDDKEQGMIDHNSQETSIMGVSSEKSRAQLKIDIDFRADELYVFRSSPLGLDRRRNRYWQFMTSHAAEDPGCGRIFFESSEDGHWEVIDTEEAFSALLANLDTRGVREAHLHGVLLKLENLIRQGMRKLSSRVRLEQRFPTNCDEDKTVDISIVRSTSNGVTLAGVKEEDRSSGDDTVFPGRESCRHMGAISIQTGNNQSEKHSILERYQEFDKWFWSKETPNLSFLAAMRSRKKRSSELLAKCDTCHDLFWHEEKHCSCCHTTFEFSSKKDARYLEHVSACDKLRSERSRKNAKLLCLSKKLPCRVLLLKAQYLCVEAAIPAEALRPSWSKEKRKMWASSLKEASSPSDLAQLLSELERAIHRDWLSRRFEPAKEVIESNTGAAVSGYPSWVPCTTAAVAMRLVELDSALFYNEEQRQLSSQRRKSISDSRACPVKKDQIQDIDTEGSKETDIQLANTDCVTGKEDRDGHRGNPEYEEALKAKLQSIMKQVDTSATKNRQGIGLRSNAACVVNEASVNIARSSHRERGKQSTSPNMDFEQCSINLRNLKADVKHELHISNRTRSLDARTSMISAGEHYKDDRRDSGTDEEIVIEEVFEEEEDVPYEEGYPSKVWIAARESAETDSMGEGVNVQDDTYDSVGEEDDGDVECKPDSRNMQDFEEDSDDEDEEVGSSDSESFDESD